MTWIRRIFDFYLDASIHVALAIICLVEVTGISLNIKVPNSLIIFVFFSALSCYNFVKYGVEAEKYILVANSYHKNIQFFSLGSLIVAFFQLFHLSEEIWIALFILGAITGLYALPVLPKHKNFRSFSGLKILIVATVWAGTTVLLPVISRKIGLTWDVWVESVQRIFLVLALLVPFEIRDLKYDDAELKTLPQRLGVNRTKIIGVLWTFSFLSLSFVMEDEPMLVLYSKLVLAFVLVILILRTPVDQGRYYASFWVEALPIFWLGFLWLGKNFV